MLLRGSRLAEANGGWPRVGPALGGRTGVRRGKHRGAGSSGGIARRQRRGMAMLPLPCCSSSVSWYPGGSSGTGYANRSCRRWSISQPGSSKWDRPATARLRRTPGPKSRRNKPPPGQGIQDREIRGHVRGVRAVRQRRRLPTGARQRARAREHREWDDAIRYAQWLSDTTGRAYRLPSEAQCEIRHAAGHIRFWWERCQAQSCELSWLRGRTRDRCASGRYVSREPLRPARYGRERLRVGSGLYAS